MKRMMISYGCLAVAIWSCSTLKYAANHEYPAADDGYTPQGRLEEVIYEPTEDGPSQRRMLVYLPDGYDTSGKDYPVLYLLHGAKGNETSWINKGHILRDIDSLTRTGEMEETIVVFPNTNQYDDDKDFGKSRLKNMFKSLFEMDGAVETAFMEDVVGTTDSMYRTIPDRTCRAIAGLSMGGLQTIRISAAFPDGFDYIGVFSPVIRTIVKHGKHSDFYRNLYGRLEVLFSDPPAEYIIMIGRNDILEPRIGSFICHLKRKGYGFDFYESPGGHSWYNWENYCRFFMKTLWRFSGQR